MITVSRKPTPEQIAAINKAGPGATIHTPLAGTKRGRGAMLRALQSAGLDTKIGRTLGWSAVGAVQAVPEPVDDLTEDSPGEDGEVSQRSPDGDSDESDDGPDEVVEVVERLP